MDNYLLRLVLSLFMCMLGLTGVSRAEVNTPPTPAPHIHIMAIKQHHLKNVKAALPITYHGGAVLSNYPFIYIIFYGNFTNSTTPQILTDLVSNQYQLPYYTTLHGYYSTSATVNFYMVDSPKYGGVAYDTSNSQGTNIGDAAIFNIVKNAITAKKVPLNSNAMYVVVTPADVNATSGMCTKYCGWHTSNRIGTQSVRYAYIGSPLRCPNPCSYNQTGPNGNREADGMANIIMHEVIEMMSDPDVDAWFDSSYYENADKCAWSWGTRYTSANGSQANMKIGARDFLIQQTWVNPKDTTQAGYCDIKAP